jgi:hypothetical protein
MGLEKARCAIETHIQMAVTFRLPAYTCSMENSSIGGVSYVFESCTSGS